jgi:hypothetical protein
MIAGGNHTAIYAVTDEVIEFLICPNIEKDPGCSLPSTPDGIQFISAS